MADERRPRSSLAALVATRYVAHNHMRCLFVIALALASCIDLSLAYGGPYEFGSNVMPGDNDLGRLLHDFQCPLRLIPNLAFRDIGAVPGAYDEGDPVYLDIDNRNNASLGDVRFTPGASMAAGTKVKPGDQDFDARLLPLNNWIIAYAVINGNGIYSLDDPVYLHNSGSGNTVIPNDIRLTGFSGFAAGTKVRAIDRDCNVKLVPMLSKFSTSSWEGPLATIRFYNANGNYNMGGGYATSCRPLYDYVDPIYLDISRHGQSDEFKERLFGFVVAGNVRLTT